MAGTRTTGGPAIPEVHKSNCMTKRCSPLEWSFGGVLLGAPGGMKCAEITGCSRE